MNNKIRALILFLFLLPSVSFASPSSSKGVTIVSTVISAAILVGIGYGAWHLISDSNEKDTLQLTNTTDHELTKTKFSIAPISKYQSHDVSGVELQFSYSF
ncbi:hypothetical protein A3752_17150 [Oleiphilus sp. HI0081]|uniref:hypothetical protein n=1 Tax=Oleiphilus sp. HI0132 TaxID=1822270 RepID=UPI0007C2737E|nr:hypothetical protein [Oleiphilus sp. HI0132]KZY92133.1 hypothetical protein A3743_06790 [Oleiphilus sp. HI0072]KZZ18259.1 hypothetical protein A3752_17150 [Oleiphilus sp. HI0081]KZZ75355.1 hypothetical protein A3766_16945 [Oleiphilus sp. HI0132]